MRLTTMIITICFVLFSARAQAASIEEKMANDQLKRVQLEAARSRAYAIKEHKAALKRVAEIRKQQKLEKEKKAKAKL